MLITVAQYLIYPLNIWLLSLFLLLIMNFKIKICICDGRNVSFNLKAWGRYNHLVSNARSNA
jgi:hypothetical protein